LPEADERIERLSSVLHVLYLIFNEGYTSSSGPELQRTDLATEAIRLTRLLLKLVPRNGEVTGLLSLMLLTDARRAARSGSSGELIPLDEQDRSLWDQAMIVEGTALVNSAFMLGAVGEYQIQAAIASLHNEAAQVKDTDWPQILALYGVLKRMSDNPMVEMNYAIATAMVHGPLKGLQLLADLEHDERLKDNHRLDAVRAHLLETAGERDAAVKLYRVAAVKTNSIPEKNYLMLKAAKLNDEFGLNTQGTPAAGC
jgi:predicted RNA polymerase sigma factor